MPKEKIPAEQEESDFEAQSETDSAQQTEVDSKVKDETDSAPQAEVDSEAEKEASFTPQEEINPEEEANRLKRKKLIETVKLHIAIYHRWGVAELMRKLDVEGISKVLSDDQFDYSVFKWKEQPKFLIEELDLESKNLDYLLAVVLYIWDHPVVKDDTKFFEYYEEFRDLIAEKAKPGSVEENIANVMLYKELDSRTLPLQELLGVTPPVYAFDREEADGEDWFKREYGDNPGASWQETVIKQCEEAWNATETSS